MHSTVSYCCNSSQDSGSESELAEADELEDNDETVDGESNG